MILLSTALVLLATGDGEILRPGFGAVLVLEDGRLSRRADGGGESLGVSIGEDTGRVLDASVDPAGLVFVAAEAGLFVVDGRSKHLDPVALEDGGPEGAPTSVHVDARRRLWVATETAVGVLDPSFYWGRTLGPDELPGSGPYRLEPGEDGGLVIHGTAGSLVYRPDDGEPPRVVSCEVNGKPWSGGKLAATYRDAIKVVATGAGIGGASLRYRLDGHHVWHPIEGELVLDRLSPGSHRLDIVAIDRDLNRSDLTSVGLRIDYPFYYGRAFVIAVGTVLSAVTMLLFVLRARGAGAAAYGRALLSTGLVLVIGVQILAGLVPHNKAWPFVGYSMYSQRYHQDGAIYDAQLVGLGESGGTWEIAPQALGVAVDGRWQVLHPIIDGGDAAARDVVERYRERFPNQAIIGVQVQAKRMRLTAKGPVRVAPLVLAHYRETGDG